MNRQRIDDKLEQVNTESEFFFVNRPNGATRMEICDYAELLQRKRDSRLSVSRAFHVQFQYI